MKKNDLNLFQYVGIHESLQTHNMITIKTKQLHHIRRK